jgi:prophage maintenance system killer protein
MALWTGNKRTALFMMSLLLGRSGYNIGAANERQLNTDVETMILDVVEHRMSFEELVGWLEQRIVRDED